MPRTTLRNVLCYETLLAAAASQLPFRWPVTDEEAACGLCYTSGTTGNPKVRVCHTSDVDPELPNPEVLNPAVLQ